MPCAPILEGPLLFLPPFEIHGFCVLLFSMFGLEMLCHWQVLFICKCWSERARIWSQEPQGQGLGGLTTLEWVCGLNVFLQGLTFFCFSCWCVVAYGAVHLTSPTESTPHLSCRQDSTLRKCSCVLTLGLTETGAVMD